MRRFAAIFGFSFILAIVGFGLWNRFFDLSVDLLYKPQLKVLPYPGQFLTHIAFAAVVGLIPLIYYATIRYIRINLFEPKLTTLSIILMSGMLFWQLRILHLQSEISGFTVDNVTVLGMMHLPTYLLIGLVVGALLSIVTFRRSH
jgi:hypothetical protein